MKKIKIFKNPIVKVLATQVLIFFSLIIIDLYLFRGVFTSQFYIYSNDWLSEQTLSCELKINKIEKDKYLLSFKNNSISPKYFINYRNEEYFQNVPDSLFFLYSEKKLHPNNDYDYSSSFDCGTGLGLTSINPLEYFEIEKSYDQIIKECSHINFLEKTDFISHKLKYRELKYKQIDSLIKAESKLLSKTDSIEVEYFIEMNSFITKQRMYTVSNKIKLSLKDLLDQYQQ